VQCTQVPSPSFLIKRLAPGLWGTQSKAKNCGTGGCRYSLSAFKLVQKESQPMWPQFKKAKQLYKHLINIVFSKEFEAALWKKLGVTKKIQRREFRILSDKNGFSNGRIHTDLQARKVSEFPTAMAVDVTVSWEAPLSIALLNPPAPVNCK
jgi:hypothetical protein